MKISKSWLNDYVDCADLSREAFYELVTTKVAEVDKVHPHAAPVAGALVALVRDVKPHPAKDKLVVARVTTGRDEIDVVCGAPNCIPGMLTAYVPPGGSVEKPDGSQVITVEARDVLGVPSVGVLVSEAELGLTGDHRGIFDLTVVGGAPKPGDALAAFVGEPDIVLEIDNKSLTHRPDLWCHFGFARELSAILGRPLKRDPDRFADDTREGRSLLESISRAAPTFKIKVDRETKSHRFSTIGFAGASCQASPLWIRRRLSAVGAGVRNLLVDLSNYVMHDIGQPNHAYDADLLRGDEIRVRYAEEGEEFAGLDGMIRALTKDDVVIADRDGAVALGGIIGGARSSIQDTTSALLLECAHFDPVVVRLTAKRHAIRTDASMRFEKSRSPYAVPLALHRFAELLTSLDPKVSVSAGLSEDFPVRPNAVSIPFRYDYIRSRLDPAVSADQIKSILTSLRFGVTDSGPGAATARVPYERATRDVTIEDDLVEEVGRIFGYGNMAEVAPLISSDPQPVRPIADLESRVRARLTADGFSEIYLYSFMNRERAEALGYDTSDAVELLNPIDAESSVVRNTLVPGIIGALERNARFLDRGMVFELGRSYQRDPVAAYGSLENGGQVPNAVASERRILALGYYSDEGETRLGAATTPPVSGGASWYSVARSVQSLVRLVTVERVELRPIELPEALSAELFDADRMSRADDFSEFKRWMHPRRAATIVVSNVALGVIAEVSPVPALDVPPRSIVAEIDLSLLLSIQRDVGFTPLAKFPPSFFELSVVMPERAHYAALERLLYESIEPGYIRELRVLDVYRGSPLKEGEKSVSVKLSLGHDERTLSSDELALLQNRLVDGVNAAFQVRTG